MALVGFLEHQIKSLQYFCFPPSFIMTIKPESDLLLIFTVPLDEWIDIKSIVKTFSLSEIEVGIIRF